MRPSLQTYFAVLHPVALSVYECTYVWLVEDIVVDSELVTAYEARTFSPKNVSRAGALEGRVKLGPDDLILHWDWWLVVFIYGSAGKTSR